VNATAKYYLSDFDTSTPEKEAALLETARTFASECVAEMGNPDILPYLGTAQAVEDLEIFRQVIGDEKFWLYGESWEPNMHKLMRRRTPIIRRDDPRRHR
jgi:hypothetical protein